MFLTRVLTAAVLLAAFLAALLWLDRAAFAILVAIVVGLGAFEWGRLAGLARGFLAAYAVACPILFGLLLGGALVEPVLWAAALFWIIAVPGWLAAGVRPKPRLWLLAAGVAALVPTGLAMAALPPGQLLMVLGLTWISHCR